MDLVLEASPPPFIVHSQTFRQSSVADENDTTANGTSTKEDASSSPPPMTSTAVTKQVIDMRRAIMMKIESSLMSNFDLLRKDKVVDWYFQAMKKHTVDIKR
jgi:hypothetical protein